MQNRQCSFSRSRPFGARCVAASSQPFHSQHGASARGPAVFAGLDPDLVEKGELNFMTDHYADLPAGSFKS